MLVQRRAEVLHCVVCCRLKSNLPLGSDVVNWSPFSFDKYSFFNLGPAVIQNYQEATLTIFMNPNISLIAKPCCSFVWQRKLKWGNYLKLNKNSKTRSFPSAHWRHIKGEHSWCRHTVRGHRGPNKSVTGYMSFYGIINPPVKQRNIIKMEHVTPLEKSYFLKVFILGCERHKKSNHNTSVVFQDNVK